MPSSSPLFSAPDPRNTSATRAMELDRIFRLESERTVGSYWVLRYENQYFQLQPQSRHYTPASGKVQVCDGREGNLTIEYRGHALRWEDIPLRSGSSATAQRLGCRAP